MDPLGTVSLDHLWRRDRRHLSGLGLYAMSRKHLSARDREKLFDEHKGICHICKMPIDHGQRWEVSHPIELGAGGEDVPENRKPAHYRCHRLLTAEVSQPLIAKVRRIRQKHIGARPKRPWPKRTFRQEWRT